MAESTKLKLKHISLTTVKLGDKFIVTGNRISSHTNNMRSAYLSPESTRSLFPMSGTKYVATKHMRSASQTISAISTKAFSEV